jgi:hypothetical protein
MAAGLLISTEMYANICCVTIAPSSDTVILARNHPFGDGEINATPMLYSSISSRNANIVCVRMRRTHPCRGWIIFGVAIFLLKTR